jgi:hypothetical protein
MVRVLSVKELEMQIDPSVRPQGFKEMLHEFRVQVSEVLSWDFHLEERIGAARKINAASHQGLIHGDVGVSKPDQAGLVRYGQRECLPQGNPNVFHGMMGVDVKVPFAPQMEIKQAMLREAGEHMVKKVNSGLDSSFADAVQIEAKMDIRLFGLSIDDCNAVPFFHSVISSRYITGCRFAGALSRTTARS